MTASLAALPASTCSLTRCLKVAFSVIAAIVVLLGARLPERSHGWSPTRRCGADPARFGRHTRRPLCPPIRALEAKLLTRATRAVANGLDALVRDYDAPQHRTASGPEGGQQTASLDRMGSMLTVTDACSCKDWDVLVGRCRPP